MVGKFLFITKFIYLFFNCLSYEIGFTETKSFTQIFNRIVYLKCCCKTKLYGNFFVDWHYLSSFFKYFSISVSSFLIKFLMDDDFCNSGYNSFLYCLSKLVIIYQPILSFSVVMEVSILELNVLDTNYLDQQIRV